MNYSFDTTLSVGYKSNTQKIRLMSEHWLKQNIFCPCCGNPYLIKQTENSPVFDFWCDNCGEEFELKSKRGKFSSKIVDGAYHTMLQRISSVKNPHLFILNYSKQLEVVDLTVIPKFFFTPQIIEKRKPLSATARRAGWTGCNILLSKIPTQGRIEMIKEQLCIEKSKILSQYNTVKSLQTNDIEKRGWLFDVLNCINALNTPEFTLQQIYAFTPLLRDLHPDNNNVEAKIRQQLQILRNKNILEFLGAGYYRKKI